MRKLFSKQSKSNIMGKVKELTKSEPSNTQGVTLSAKVPKVMLEILFYGDEQNKEQNKIMLDNLQKQLAKPNNDGKARIFWCTDKEKTDEEKKQFLVENSECLYYVVVSLETQIDNNFVRKHLSKIENLSKAISEMKAMNIIPKKK